MTKLATMFRQTMAEHNWGERELAEAMGVKRGVVRTVLAGGIPKPPQYELIAAYYQRTVAWVLEQLGVDPGGGDIRERIAALANVDARVEPIMTLIYDAHPDDVPYLLSVLEAASRRRRTPNHP